MAQRREYSFPGWQRHTGACATSGVPLVDDGLTHRVRAVLGGSTRCAGLRVGAQAYTDSAKRPFPSPSAIAWSPGPPGELPMSGAPSLADARQDGMLAALQEGDWGRVRRHYAYCPHTAIVSIECDGVVKRELDRLLSPAT